MTHDWATVDFYERLGVSRDASAEAIGDAFRRLAKQLHPDVIGADGPSAERFKDITAAYEVLSDPRRRADYDAIAPAVGDQRDLRSGAMPLPVTPLGVRRAARSWSPLRVGFVTVVGVVVAVAGLAFAVAIVVIQAGERSDLAARREVVGTAVVGLPRLRLAYFAGRSERPYLAAIPDAATADFEPGEVVTVRVQSGSPLNVAYGPATPPEFDTAVQARVVTSASGAVVVHDAEGSIPIVNPDPSPSRSAGLRDGAPVRLFVAPDDPTDVRIGTSTAARDVAFWVVAVKLMVAGPFLVWFARTRRPRT